jgi:hypothetical protein
VKPGRLLIAAVVLAALGGAVYFSNKSEAAKAAKPAADAAAKIIALPEGDITQIEVKKRDGETTIVKKDGSGKWSITAPKPLPADQPSVSALANAVSSLASERVVDDHATDLPSYGLAPALVAATFTTKDGKAHQVLVGDDTPTGSNVYAMVGGDSRLFTMSSFNKSSLDKTWKDLRDKRLLTFDQDKVSRVELNTKKGLIEFGRINQNEWQILKPKPMRADGFQVEDLVRKLKGANMDTTVSDDDIKKNVASFGSAAPVATAKVTDAGGTQTLEVRKLKDDYLVKSSVVDGVHKVPKDVGEGVDKTVDDFRGKKLFDFGFSDPSRIDFKDGAKTVTFEKSGDQWKSAGKTIDSTSLQAFIDKLRDLSAAKFVEVGFTTPVIELTVVSSEGKRTEKVQIAPAGADFIAKREGDSSLYQITGSTVTDLRQAGSDVKEAAPPSPTKEGPQKK